MNCYTAEQLAEAVGCHRTEIYNGIATGKITPDFRAGRVFGFRPESIEAIRRKLRPHFAAAKSTVDDHVSPMSDRDFINAYQALEKIHPPFERLAPRKALQREYRLSRLSPQSRQTLAEYFDLQDSPVHRGSGRVQIFCEANKRELEVSLREYDSISLPDLWK